jgi:nicotinamidase-related amidase
MAEQQDIDPRRAAIVAIDFQHDNVGADGAFADLFHAEVKRTDLIPTATRLLGEACAAGVKIVYSTGTFQPGYPDLVPNIPLLSHRVSGFHGTDLDVVLRGAGIDTVIVAGVATNMAVESTARASADLGYRTLVVSDACSTTSETAHNASLASMAMLGGVVTTDDLLATLRARASSLDDDSD